MSLYLKYRPADFDNLVGQEFINTTLKKAITDEKTVGAYLFCGPRGTGKTSTARLLAKTINCIDSKNGNPCLQCDICKDFADDRLIDIIEIDAASHTGVDNIREIIEKAQFTPTHTKYKVYIIDEVHMLSKGAFNALLKILEEPPSHVKFILATTETHKVPETIISRCQRYDFKRISDSEIKSRLEYVAGEEKVSIDEASMEYIIKNSGGGLRNALSLFEQLIVDNAIHYNDVIKNLGIVESDLLENFLNKLLSSDQSIITDYEGLISDGKNIKLFFKELIFYIKDMMLVSLKKGNNISEHIRVLDILDESYIKTKNSLDENTTFLVGIVKIITHYTPAEKIVSETVVSQPTSTPVIKAPAPIKEEIPMPTDEPIQQKEELSADSIGDIFGEPDLPVSGGSSVNLEGSSGFNTENFIKELRNQGAKGGLSMALRGCNIALLGSELRIQAPTMIAKNQVNNPDNQALILQTLVIQGTPDATIILL